MTDSEGRRAVDEESVLALLVSGAEGPVAPRNGGCPEANALAGFSDGATPIDVRVALETHLSVCAECRAIVAAVASTAARPRDRPAASPDAVFPRPFGPYVLLRRLGGGGMGDVFEASHPQRARTEALKQLRAGLDDDPRAAERFLREIRAVSAIRHEHVVPLHDSGVVDGIAYYTMPLLPGPSLAGLLASLRRDDGRFPTEDAEAALDALRVAPAPATSDDSRTRYARRVAASLADVARGLAALHGAGMVHRDVKPSNLVFDGRGRLVLTDLGLVRLDAARMTRTGEALGTPSYMAPEQLVSGAVVDGRADVYALGASLYEALALVPPHEGRSVAETIAHVLRGPPRALRERARDLPREFDVVVGRCLERLPLDRYADAESLARDLDRCARGEPVSARPMSAAVRAARFVQRRRAPVAIAASVLAGLAIFAMTRPGRLSVRALPKSQVAVDGEPAGSTPLLDRRVAAGEHFVALRRDGFAPLERAIALEHGGAYELDVVLRALDPADPATLKLLAAERGVGRAEVEFAVDRGPAPAAQLAVLLPRGNVREMPAEVSLWSEAPAPHATVRLEAVGEGDAPVLVHEWKDVSVFRRVVLAVPDDSRRAARPGRFRVSISAGDRKTDAPFVLLGDVDSRAVGKDLDALTRGFEQDDLVPRFLEVDRLIERGLFVDALASAARLRHEVGDRKEVARLALAAMDRAGLREVGPWFDWAQVYLRAEK